MMVDFEEICRRRHLKITPQRTAIFRILFGFQGHPTADDVYREIRAQFPNISFDTVNRTLLTFAQAGMIETIEDMGHCRRFDLNMRPHHHVYCIRCGSITDFVCPEYDDLAIPEEIERRFQVSGKRMVLKGLCDACRAISEPQEDTDDNPADTAG